MYVNVGFKPVLTLEDREGLKKQEAMVAAFIMSSGALSQGQLHQGQLHQSNPSIRITKDHGADLFWSGVPGFCYFVGRLRRGGG